MTTDPIADMLTRIRNAVAVRKDALRVPYSGVNYAIAMLLARHGYIANVARRGGRRGPRILELVPQYKNGIPIIRGLVRISRPGRRVYKKVWELKPWRQGVGLVVLSTPQGIMTHIEARKKRVGGEALLAIW